MKQGFTGDFEGRKREMGNSYLIAVSSNCRNQTRSLESFFRVNNDKRDACRPR